MHKPGDINNKYAIVYFHSVEDASAAIESLEHPKVKFGNDYPPRGSQGRGGSFSSRGTYGSGSYDARKMGVSDSDRAGFGRGGRGGRGGPRGAGSSGSFSRGSSSPGPSRGGPSRGRAGMSSASYSRGEISGDKQEWQDKPEKDNASWPSEEKPPTAPSEDHHQSSSADPPTTTTTLTAAASTAGQSSTAGESQQSS